MTDAVFLKPITKQASGIALTGRHLKAAVEMGHSYTYFAFLFVFSENRNAAIWEKLSGFSGSSHSDGM